MSKQPAGIRFYDNASGYNMLLVTERGELSGWLCYQHVDGQWVTLRQSTIDDRACIEQAIRGARLD